MRAAPVETIRIETGNRWDALDLARRLPGLHTYLVQLGNRRWHVCVKPDGEADAVIPVVRRAAEAWAEERHVCSVLRVGNRTYDLNG
jgi:uncharacterized protein (DUF2252 family)